jgi:hypothetical protein
MVKSSSAGASDDEGFDGNADFLHNGSITAFAVAR